MLDEFFDKFSIDELEKPTKETVRDDKKAVLKKIGVARVNAFSKKYAVAAALVLCIILYEFALHFVDTDSLKEATTECSVLGVLQGGGNYEKSITLSETDIEISTKPLTREEIEALFTADKIPFIVADIKRECESRDRLVDSGYAEDNPYKAILESGSFYVSAIAYQAYSFEKKQMEKPLLIVFDKDANYVGNIRLAVETCGYKYEKIVARPDEIYIADTIMEHKDQSFAAVYFPTEYGSGLNEAYITAENTVYQKYGHGLLELRGDVYGKLSEFSFSYDRFTSPDNLIEIDFNMAEIEK